MKIVRARTQNEEKKKKDLADFIKYCRKEERQEQFSVAT